MNAPAGFNVMWNTALLGLAILCVPLTLTIGPFATIGLLMTISPLVSAGATFVVVRAISRSWWGALIAGLMYGFGPYSAGHFGHLNLIFAPFPPVLLWLLWRLIVATQDNPSTEIPDGDESADPVPAHELRTRTNRSLIYKGVLLGVAASVQFLVSEELLLLSGVVAVGGLLAGALTHPGLVVDTARRVAAPLGLALAVFGVVVALPLTYQLFGPGALVSGVSHGRSQADLISLVRPSLLQADASHADIHANLATKTANGAENTAFLGWPLIVLCLGLVAWSALRRERFAAWWTLTTVGTVLLTLGTPIMLRGRVFHSGPWELVKAVPFLGSALPVRFSCLTALLIGLLIARSLARARGPLFGVLLLATVVAIAPWRTIAPFSSNPIVATPRFFTTSAKRAIPAGSVIMVLPSPAFPNVDGLVWQIRSGMRFDLVGGYSVFRNGKKSSYFAKLPVFASTLIQASNGAPINQAGANQVRSSVAASGVKFIVITSSATNQANLLRAAERMTGCVPQPVADVILCKVGH